jgi:hypothetical protein
MNRIYSEVGFEFHTKYCCLMCEEELTFPFLPTYTFVLDLEWCVWAPITKLLSGFRRMISASDPSRIAPFRGYMLKILALKRVQ